MHGFRVAIESQPGMWVICFLIPLDDAEVHDAYVHACCIPYHRYDTFALYETVAEDTAGKNQSRSRCICLKTRWVMSAVAIVCDIFTGLCFLVIAVTSLLGLSQEN